MPFFFSFTHKALSKVFVLPSQPFSHSHWQKEHLIQPFTLLCSLGHPQNGELCTEPCIFMNFINQVSSDITSFFKI